MLVGVQCKLHTGTTRSKDLQTELRDEVEKANAFEPAIGRYIFLTTAPNDIGLQRQAHEINAANRANGAFEVHVHAWDWIEAKLEDFPNIAVKYGLTAYRPAEAPSPTMIRIGQRFDEAIALINAGRHAEDHLQHAEIAAFLGRSEWRELERISAGTSTADIKHLQHLAQGLGLNPEWLIHGKDEPFRLDDGLKQAREQFDALIEMRPRRIVFARSQGERQDTVVAAQRDDLRWWVFTESHPTHGKVGGTGRHQIFDFACLARRLYRRFWLSDTRCQGARIAEEDYQRLISGQAHPGAILRSHHNDPWWEYLGEMDLELPGPDDPDTRSLRAAIDIAREVLKQFQQSPKNSGRHDLLAEAGLPLKSADGKVRLDMGVGPPDPVTPKRSAGWPKIKALELGEIKFWFTGSHDGAVVDGTCEIKIVNRAKIALADCRVRLISIETDDGEVPVGADFRTVPLQSGQPHTFQLAAGEQRTLRIAGRDLKDIITRPPWRLALSSGDYDLPDGGRYRLRLELWSNYEFPTKVDLLLNIDHGKAVAAKIRSQSV